MRPGRRLQISYELGETFLLLVDLKCELLSDKVPGRVLDPVRVKASDREKLNALCRSGLAALTYFGHMFRVKAAAPVTRNTSHFRGTAKEVLESSLEDLLADKYVCTTPDEGVRVFLHIWLFGEDPNIFVN